MSDLTRQIAGLSQEKRELLRRMLKAKGVDLNRTMIIPVSRETNLFPLSFAQQRLWFLEQLEPGSAVYNIPSAVRLTGRLNLPAMKLSLEEIVRRHETLRTVFTSLNGEPFQVILPRLDLPLEVCDLGDRPEAEQEAEAMRAARSEAMKPFDLETGPLFRILLLRLSETDHIVLFTMHHIISDGWSMGVLTGELAALYASFSRGAVSPLPELPFQYVDFAAWQRQWLQGEELDRQLTYWKERLSGGSPVLNLPTDRPRPPALTSNGANIQFRLPAGLHTSLKELSTKEGATLFMTLLAAFQVLLYRYTGQEHIRVGTPVANRGRAELESLIGFFVNTLVIQTDLSGDPSFRTLLNQVREVSLGAYSHQDLPIEMLVESVQPERDLSHTPLFQVMFVLEDAQARLHRLPELVMAPLDIDSGTAKFDLTLVLIEDEQGLDGMLEYNLNLFDEATIRRLSGHFQTLLKGIVADPGCPVSLLPIFTPAELRQILMEWNRTRRPFPADKTAHQLFEAQVSRTPDAAAVVYPGQQLTYRELNSRANQLANSLKKRGVKPETLVAICLDRSVEMIVCILGVLKAGGAYLPLDPLHPSDRLTFMLEDSGAALLLTQEKLSHQIPFDRAHSLYLDLEWEEISREPEANPESQAGPENLAYVIYTSGSTGRPKGTLLEHRGLCSMAVEYCRLFDLGVGSRLLQFVSPGFDASVGDIFMTLLSGAALVLAPLEVVKSPVDLHELLRKAEITTLMLTPSMLSLLPVEGLPSLKNVGVGGEICPVELAAAWSKDKNFFNLYGPTEATVVSSFYKVEKLTEGARTVPIGRPFANTFLLILDKNNRPAPIGVPGELYIGGVGTARGYLNRPELTEERFIEISTLDLGFPMEELPGTEFGKTRIYKTGDLARYGPDGLVEFLGRIDFQVKIRGFRIELGEVEAVLAQIQGLRESVVAAREDLPGEVRLVAYIVPEKDVELNQAELRSSLKQQLPDYMIPSAFVWLPALPLSPNGKVDRKALPAPDGSRPDLDRQYTRPRTPVEEILCGIWAGLLGVHQVGIYDSFFDLGGHSLLATQLVSRIRSNFSVEVSLRDLFEHPSAAEMAERVEILLRTQRTAATPPIQPVPRDMDLPLSFAQQRLWFLDQLEPGSPQYNIPVAVRLDGPLDIAALSRSLNEIVRRHEVLRTSFPSVEGKAIQFITADIEVPLPLFDLSFLPFESKEITLRQLMNDEARQTFNLASGPLLRAILIRLDDSEHVVLLVMHHIVSDGWSSEVFTREIAALYKAFSEGLPSPLPDLPVQYVDFAAWQRNWLTGQVLEDQLSYWKDQLQGLPPVLELPVDRRRPSVQTSRGRSYDFVLSPDLTKPLLALSRQEGATLFMTLLAAFQVLLYRYTRQEDFGVGTPIANRSWAEVENLIGFFVNTLVLRADVSGSPSFRELLGRVRQTALGAYANQDVPFEMIVDALQPQRDLSHTPLFQVMFLLQNAQAGFLELPSLALSTVDIETGVASFDLTLAMRQGEEGLSGAWEFNADLFDLATIQRMTAHFQMLLEGVLSNPDEPVAHQPLLNEAERQQILYEWNHTAKAFPTEACVHQLFEAQARITPDALAVLSPAGEGETCQRLTYAELDRRANQLAYYLRKLGVGPDRLVGLSVERSPDMAVCLLGILKAGGAYLPLDPDYPPERLLFMMEDALGPGIGKNGDHRAGVLVTHSHLVERLPAHDLHVICMDRDWDKISQESDAPIDSGVAPENLAYVIYTSGSTGQPKGVMIRHRNVVNHNLAVVDEFGLQPGDRVLQFATLNFDTAVEEIFPTWAAGATLVLRPGNLLLSGDELTRLVDKERLSVLDLPTAYWQEWVYELALTGRRLPDSLRLVVVGGDKASAESLDQWRKIAGDRVAWMNTYGPTEATIIASLYQAPYSSCGEEPGGEVPIGHPIANVQLYVLDPNLLPLPAGVPGELYIGGAGVARGYLNRPELTRERFIPDPFLEARDGESGIRRSVSLSGIADPPLLYKTGDLVKWRVDGNLEFLGRVDNQVKIRGFRVEPGEIEAVLEGHPSVRMSAVIPREEGENRKRLVAYVVVHRPSSAAASELRAYLNDRLPAYMVPSSIVLMEGLPLTPSGKIDRRALAALPMQEAAQTGGDEGGHAPRTHQEEIMAEIWSQVLRRRDIGLHDNFFELGGDSILSIQVVARANQAGLRLTPRQLFEHPTIAGLMNVVSDGGKIEAEQGLVEGSFPLTPVQRWFFDQEFSDPHYFNQAVLLEVRQPLDRDFLKKAVEKLIEHHDALRLRFVSGKDGPEAWQAGLGDEIPFEWIDLSNLADAAQKAAVEKISEKLQASLNLSDGPILRIAYFERGHGRTGRLLMVIHHLAVDGISWRILLEDLQTAYSQLSQSQALHLPAKTTSYRGWAYRLAAHAQTEKVRAEASYWLSIAMKKVARLPVDFPGGDNLEASAHTIHAHLNAEETRALLQEVPAVYHTQINDVLLAALALTISRWTGEHETLVELEGHGREDILESVDISRTVGWFTTLYPVILSIKGNSGPGETIKAVKEQLRQVPEKGIGYGLLRFLNEDASIRESLLALPQPEISFNYLGQFNQAEDESSPFSPAGESKGDDRSPRCRRLHLIDVNGVIYAGQLNFDWTYSRNHYRAATIECLAWDYLETIRSMITFCLNPEAGGFTPSDFPLAALDQKGLDKVLKKIKK